MGGFVSELQQNIIYYDETPTTELRPAVVRRMGHTGHLMMTIIDFGDGPKTQPDPPHSHAHEQVTYVAEGEILFVLEGQATRLCPGDMFLVPSGKPHSIQQLTRHVRLVVCFTPIREDFLEKE
jgi:quercetin dioxygenase-like cupin family protein